MIIGHKTFYYIRVPTGDWIKDDACAVVDLVCNRLLKGLQPWPVTLGPPTQDYKKECDSRCIFEEQIRGEEQLVGE